MSEHKVVATGIEATLIAPKGTDYLHELVFPMLAPIKR